MKGDVVADGKKAKDMTGKEFAQHVAYVPQNHTPPFGFSVMDMVLMRCVSRLGPLETPGKSECEKAQSILDNLQIGHLSDRIFIQLSGGEAQMTLIARALMQDLNMLLMDEPTAALDIGRAMDVLSVVKRLSKQGRGTIMITHDPDQCFLCATKVVLVAKNGKVGSDDVDEVVTPENLKSAYAVYVDQDDGV